MASVSSSSWGCRCPHHCSTGVVAGTGGYQYQETTTPTLVIPSLCPDAVMSEGEPPPLSPLWAPCLVLGVGTGAKVEV